MKKILFVAHCLLNTASKVELYNEKEIQAEEALRQQFLSKAIADGIQLVQLPCPEFLMYGTTRWGHVAEQFDNPFFRRRCHELLDEVMLQLKEYLSYPNKFDVLGIVGIDGSPSCGVTYTCSGSGWGGDFSGRQAVWTVLEDVTLIEKQGVFMDELAHMLREESIVLPFVGLFAPEPERVFSILK